MAITIHEARRLLKEDAVLSAASSKINQFMPLVIPEFRLITCGMTETEIVAYINLLIAAWSRDAALPMDEATQARIVGLSRKKWAAVKSVMLTGFEALEGELVHGGLLMRRLAAAKSYSSHSVRGRRGAEVKKAMRHGLRVIENTDYVEAGLEAGLEAEVTQQRSLSVSLSPLSPIQGDDVRKALGADYEEGLS